MELVKMAIAVALGMLVYDTAWELIDRAKDAWVNRPGADEVDPPSVTDGSGPVGRVAEPAYLPQVPSAAGERRESRWWTNGNNTLHLAGCSRLTGNARPWPWADTLEEARLVAGDQELKVCGSCNPLDDHEWSKPDVAVSS